MEKYRAWFFDGSKYIMIHLDEHFNHLKPHNIKSLMKCVSYVDRNGKDIYEKDILDINGNKAMVFMDKDNILQLLYSNGTIQSFGEHMTRVSKVIGNIFESPLVAFN